MNIICIYNVYRLTVYALYYVNMVRVYIICVIKCNYIFVTFCMTYLVTFFVSDIFSSHHHILYTHFLIYSTSSEYFRNRISATDQILNHRHFICYRFLIQLLVISSNVLFHRFFVSLSHFMYI